MHADPFDLERFVAAQRSNYDDALAELRAGRKTSHWMWYVLPQLRGLGRSPMAQRYGIESLDEARAYLAHPVLGSRLRACVDAVNALPGDDPVSVLGAVDAAKFRSCLTLFLAAAPGDPAFAAALAKYYGGHEDERTLALLQHR
ncbi:MAG: DUF1810 domain-containing protein [Burkholderiales bacterium]